MFPLDLDDQAGVMCTIHTFVDVCLNFDISDEAFIFNLERLYCAFEAFKQEGLEYAASLRAFIAVTEYVNSQRGMLSLSLIHISEPTRPVCSSRMPSSA